MIADFDIAHSVEISHPLIQKNASPDWTKIKNPSWGLDFISASGKQTSSRFTRNLPLVL
jgi:hypothetical protein